MRILTDRDPGDETKPMQDLDVLNWRYEELERAGYPVEVAITLAAQGDVDLHMACELLASGCSLKTALKILT